MHVHELVIRPWRGSANTHKKCMQIWWEKIKRNFIYKISFKHSNKRTLSLYYWPEFLGLTRSRLLVAQLIKNNQQFTEGINIIACTNQKLKGKNCAVAHEKNSTFFLCQTDRKNKTKHILQTPVDRVISLISYRDDFSHPYTRWKFVVPPFDNG